ncbi:hypothetical protein Tsubulata_027695 [Turnera subulata]|uniref:PHD-type domain-containing protein n=1 Tax=Turnera subulata TaxID=218843 RepID=A0A9Q0FET6_9ROSI|nr:hypothetical protein Tsubulata_027695 [Turnera subulata]
MEEELNGYGSKLEEEEEEEEESPSNRAVPFDIDLNETPICSPREAALAVAGDDGARSEAADGSGKGKVVLLDINALPSEQDGEEVEEEEEEQSCKLVNYFGVHRVGETSSAGDSNSTAVTGSNLFALGNHFDLTKTSGSMTSFAMSSPVDIIQPRLNYDRNLIEAGMDYVFMTKHWASDYSTHALPFQNLSEKFLQALREYVFNNNGILEDGWHVEFSYCQKRCKTLAVYCSPDGNRFESMLDVACHLGLVSNCYPLMPQERSDKFVFVRSGLHLNKRSCEESFKSSFCGELSLGTVTMGAEACQLRSNLIATGARPEGNGGCDSLEHNDEFPVQFEDFFILSVGEVDPRPSYHNAAQIWPIGYKSSWHDKITGSLFVCNISDGGDCGPVFQVQRFPCSAKPIPIGSTVLSRPSFGAENRKVSTIHDVDVFEDINVEMMFSESSPPHLDFDVMHSAGYEAHDVYNSQPMCESQSQNIAKQSTNHKRFGDEIGEFQVEGRSSSSVWRMVSENLVRACREIYQRNGVCKFCCSHDTSGWCPSCVILDNVRAIESTNSLAKFCHTSGPFDIPCEIHSSNELTNCSEALGKWLDQDRFGLDVAFVQEIIEQLPGVHACVDYTFLNKRCKKSELHTVGSGFLLAKRKSDARDEREADGTLRGCKRLRKQAAQRCPPGNFLSSKLPIDMIGDVLESWELLWRFSGVFGLEEAFSFKELEDELIDCSSDVRGSSVSMANEMSQHALSTDETEPSSATDKKRRAPDASNSCRGRILTKAHCSLLKVLFTELQPKLSAFMDPTLETGESKPRKRRKKEADNLTFAKKTMLDWLPINELTWPELARRYMLAVSLVGGNLDSVDILNRESSKVFNCLQGHSGPLCASLPGVAGMEADALLIAEATKKIFGSSNSFKDHLNVEPNDSDAAAACETENVNESEIPEWALALEPVRKLPTNVGARIRKRIYEALEKNPPEWAKKVLEHSISKEVYKGNASGPTKKAVLSVLARVHDENQEKKPTKRKKCKYAGTSSDVIMKQCRKVLRRAAAADEDKVFCNLLGRTLLHSSDNDDGGLLGFSTMVSRPLDFRTIDLRLAFGAYGESHEAFLEDVREVWQHIRAAYADQTDLLHLAETLSQNFEELYQKEVLILVNKLTDYDNAECLSSEAKRDMEDIFEQSSEIPKAPWDEGVCKICGVDKDDDSVLLCDQCDSGYHTYCLNPPLARIPEGNWYCPSCVTGQCTSEAASQVTQSAVQCHKNRRQGDSDGLCEALNNLGLAMEVKDYWEYSIQERIFLLKFLGDEVLNSSNIREHLEHCTSKSADFQQKLRSLSAEWRNLRFREEILAEKVGKINVLNSIRRSGKGGMTVMLPNHDNWLSINGASSCSFPLNDEVQFDDGLQQHRTSDFFKQKYTSAKGSSTKQSTGSQSQSKETLDSECQVIQLPGKDNWLINENICSNMPSSFARDERLRHNDPVTMPQQQEHLCNGDYASSVDLKKDGEFKQGSGCEMPACDSQQGHNSSGTSRTHVADYIYGRHMNAKNLFSGHCSFPQPDVSGLQACNFEANFVKNKISVLQDSIAFLESQLQKVSLRKDFLGRDSAGRLYWIFFRPGSPPWVVVDGAIMAQQLCLAKERRDLLSDNSTRIENFNNFEGSNVCSQYACPQTDGVLSSRWFSYQSDAEIQELIRWLRDGDLMEKQLLESLLQRLLFGYKESNGNVAQDMCEPISDPTNDEKTVGYSDLGTKALIALEKKYGPFLEMDETKNQMNPSWNAEETFGTRLCRCTCLELLWPSRHHCLVCHMSVSTPYQLKEHKNGKCNLDAQTSRTSSKVTGKVPKGKVVMRSEQGECSDKAELGESSRGESDLRLVGYAKDLASPYDLEDISAKFVTRNCNKELVRKIGLLGTDGTPSFVPTASPYLCDPALKLSPSWKRVVNQKDKSTVVESQKQPSFQGISVIGKGYAINSDGSTKSCPGGDSEEARKTARENVINVKRDRSWSCLKFGHANFSEIRRPPVRSLVGRGAQILEQLKINLLDMEAALPEESLKSSKACLERRCAWRAFVKSAKSVFEMVQATVVFESMIKTEYLKNEWWYWSPLSAAVKISTVSSLALRIYSLDAAIIYDKSFCSPYQIAELGSKLNNNPSPQKNLSSNSKSVGKPVPKTPSSDPTDNSKAQNKSSKKRKGLGG